MPESEELYQALSAFFGHKAFREPQEAIIRGILDRRDVIGILPTGKSEMDEEEKKDIFFHFVCFVRLHRVHRGLHREPRREAYSNTNTSFDLNFSVLPSETVFPEITSFPLDLPFMDSAYRLRFISTSLAVPFIKTSTFLSPR